MSERAQDRVVGSADPRAGLAEERLSSLLDAVVAVSSDLELAAVLHRIVLSACELVDATYGALGVLGPAGEELVEFVTHGVSEQERAAIGAMPHGKGLLGLIIRSPRPQRVDRIQDHPDSFGFPPNHPVMTTFMGTPVRIRDQVFGNLYLTDKRGAAAFSAEDEAILTALAAAAGVAIDNARLYRRSLVQQQWGAATRDLVSALLQGQSEAEVLADAAERVRGLTGAKECLVVMPRGRELVVVAAAGATTRPTGGAVTDPAWRAMIAGPPESWTTDEALETVVPLGIPGQDALGLLVIAAPAAGSLADTGQLLDFSQRLAVGLTAASSQREKARNDLLEDRDRIARDMHDHVIQRLFATGLSLQSAVRLTAEAGVQERLEAAVDEVDAVIKDIRHTIFALHRAPGARSLTGEISGICDASSVTLGFAPSLTVRGSTADVPEQVAADLLAVIREGLSNASRHAQASQVWVRVEVEDAATVQVGDNGRGVPASVVRSGLDNLARRATSRGGSFEVARAPEGGTLLTWTVPLRHR